MAESLLDNLDIRTVDIGLVAVSRGPGSFTGVRIGVSAAKGLAWGLSIPVCGVSTLEAMAFQTTAPGLLICPVMDARRAQVYNALFEWRLGKLVRIIDDRAISLEDLTAELSTFNFQLSTCR
jgi:tRNA threonylcarbamoyladenosine biosynthesis protein TsaB